jgi:hypothetical protein
MRFSERTISAISRVDREAGVIHGVKLIGRQSRNGREYSSDALRDAIPKYEGVKVYVDHDPGANRKVDDWVGVVENPTLRSDGLYGDIRLRKQSARYEEICEAAEDFHDAFGMSHVADGESRMVGGIEIVESINEVFSVDIVTVPATASSLYESTDNSVLKQLDALLSAVNEITLENAAETAVVALQEFRKLTAMIGGAQTESDPDIGSDVDTDSDRNLPQSDTVVLGESFDFTKPGSFARRYL